MFPTTTLLIFLFLLLPCCTCRDTITAVQPLEFGASILSKENKFELGFFQSSGKSVAWYVGIWYGNLTDEKTIVWVANRDNPINDTSNVFLTIDGHGNLVIGHNNTDQVLFNVSNGSATYGTILARLLDTGNLVLVQENDIVDETPLWQSFDYPTDTILPGMKIGLNRRTGLKLTVTSWKSEDDPGTGDYSYGIDLTGLPQFFLFKGSTPVWRGNPWAWRNELANKSLYVNTYSYLNNRNEVYYTFFPIDPSRIVRMVVEKFGSFELLVWNKDFLRWDDFLASPKFRCDPYRHCGVNRKCSALNAYWFECECLLGFEPKSPTEWSQSNGSSGCVRNKRVVSSAMSCLYGDEFMKLKDVKPPDTSRADLWWNSGMSLGSTACKDACAKNCSCTAYMEIESDDGKIGCFTWNGELVDVMESMDGQGQDLYVRVDASDIAENGSKPKGFLRKRGTQAALISSVVFSLLVILAFAYWKCKKRKQKNKYEDEECRRDTTLQYFHLNTVMAATDNFSPANKLGQGGFGTVHQGQLSDGQRIAVKRLSKNSGQGLEEFKNEIMLISKLQHRNLVKLLGFCIHGEEMMLMYENMPNKSLDSLIFNPTRRVTINWRNRFDIIIGVARGVLYLHQDSRLRIIHRDLKTSNILLDAEMNPKISDFGIARIFNRDRFQDKTNKIAGTYGYMSPEYAILGKFSTKSDVFSFGVILLEIVSGMKNNHCHGVGSSINLAGHVWQLWSEDRALEIVDSLLESYTPNEALRCIQVGLLCVQDNVNDRPTMSLVVLMLSSEIALPSPKQPAYMIGRSRQDISILKLKAKHHILQIRSQLRRS